MNTYCLALSVIVLLAGVQCQEYNRIGANDSEIESNISTNLASIDIEVYVIEINNSTTWTFYGGVSEAAKLERYNITIANKGDVALNDAEITVEMPKGMKFDRNAYFGYGRGKLFAKNDPPVFDINVKNKLKWSIGELMPEERKSILFEAYTKKDMNINNTDISVKATGNDPANALVTDSEDNPIRANCDYMKDGQPCAGRFKTKVCQYTCPDWINQTI